MSENSKIEWTDHTFNPWWGCQKVSPGCDNCYAEALDKRTGGAHWGSGAERRRTSEKNWNLPRRWNDEAGKSGGRRPRVFCASMADVFDNAVPEEWRVDLWKLIYDTPNLDWLVLTKRIGNAREMLPLGIFRGSPLPNLWLGISVVNQEEANRDIGKLLAIPARVRFLSMEPLLGPVSLMSTLLNLDWVIVGGESGPGARPMHPAWARSLRDQCIATRTPFFFKQWGEWGLERYNGKPMRCFMPDLTEYRAQEPEMWHAPDMVCMTKVGKAAAGRVLDGEIWDQIPGQCYDSNFR